MAANDHPIPRSSIVAELLRKPGRIGFLYLPAFDTVPLAGMSRRRASVPVRANHVRTEAE